MADNETIADIIAEKRRRADELEASSYRPHQFLRERIAELRQEANRLEAAHTRDCARIAADALAVGGIVEAERKRESGDAAKLRAALEKIVELTTPCEGVTSIELQVQGEALTALAAPPRNCDLPKVVEDPWRAWLDDESNWEDGNPKLEIHDWLLAPATEKEGGNNG